jgi:excinuclease UvrABC nuclease subunit
VIILIKIEVPSPDVVITKQEQLGERVEAPLSSVYGFTDYNKIPRDKGGIILFYNENDDLLFVGKARKLRPRVKKHFEDTVSPIKQHRDEVYKIAVCVVEDAMDREIYETYIINKDRARYNIDKVFYK